MAMGMRVQILRPWQAMGVHDGQFESLLCSSTYKIRIHGYARCILDIDRKMVP